MQYFTERGKQWFLLYTYTVVHKNVALYFCPHHLTLLDPHSLLSNRPFTAMLAMFV